MTKILMLCCTALAPAAFGQTWVSGTGSDANPCTRTAPCLTFQHAASVTQDQGTLNVMDRGDYGTVILTRDITIDGGNLASNTAGSSAGIIVSAGAGQVVQIRNLSLVGSGSTSPTGVSFVSGGQLILDNVKVSGFATCVSVAPGGSGYVDLVIKNSSINYCTSNGISIATSGPSITAQISNTSVSYATTGLSATAGRISLRDSTISSPSIVSGNYGIYVSGADVMVDNCQITRYSYGIIAFTSVQISRSTFNYNSTAVLAETVDAVISLGNNSFFLNSSNGNSVQAPSISSLQ
jgi:hypothetical protein